VRGERELKMMKKKVNSIGLVFIYICMCVRCRRLTLAYILLSFSSSFSLPLFLFNCSAYFASSVLIVMLL
jgi:hypothetical protein